MIVTKITIFSHLFYIWNIAVTMLKYTRIVHVSRIVVIRGAAMIAGSTPTLLREKGKNASDTFCHGNYRYHCNPESRRKEQVLIIHYIYTDSVHHREQSSDDKSNSYFLKDPPGKCP